MARRITPQNGRIPAVELVDVGRGHRLRDAAGAAFLRALRDGAPAGSIREAYRDIDTQWRYWRDPPNAAGLAAVPGQSWHGEGLAIDVWGAAIGWWEANGHRFGWHRTIAREPWHFEYFEDADPSRPGALPVPDNQKERVMRETVILRLPDGRCYLYNAAMGTCELVPNPETLGALGQRYAGEVVDTTDAGFGLLASMAQRVRETQANTFIAALARVQ